MNHELTKMNDQKVCIQRIDASTARLMKRLPLDNRQPFACPTQRTALSKGRDAIPYRIDGQEHILPGPERPFEKTKGS